MNEKSRVRELKGIGEKTEKIFQKLGIRAPMTYMRRLFPSER